MKRLFCILPLFFLILGCNIDGQPKYISMSDAIVSQYLKDMKKQYNLQCFGNGGAFLEHVNEIILSFDAPGPKTREELRELLVIITEDLLRRYNDNEEIRPYLKNYPFSPENMDLAIVLSDDNGHPIHNKGAGRDLLRWISLFRGKIRYRIKNDEKAYVQDVDSETYEEALTIVKKQKPELFLGK